MPSPIPRLLPFLLLVVFSILGAHAGETQKVIVSDFEDLGTWRLVEARGGLATAWFAGDSWLGGSVAESRRDRAVGELKFAFDPAKAGPYSAAFFRQKATLVSGFLDGIEFEADANGLPVSVRFVLGDAAGKRFTTAPVPLAGRWQAYRVELNAQTLPGFKECKFPAHLERIVAESAQPCAGSLFLDDVALTGDFVRRDQLSIFPVADGVALAPGKAETLQYRLRNARPGPLPVTTRIEVRDFGGAVVFRGQRNDTIPAQGQAMAAFALPPLPVGAYAAAVTVDAGSFQVTYDDPFGVFVPNGKRLNHRAMWFGVNSVATWQGEGKLAQHLDWMRQLGIDLDRIGGEAERFEPQPGVFAFDPWRRIFAAYAKAGVDIQILYDSTPRWTQPSAPDGRAVPEDEAAYSKHVADLGTFLKEFPGVRYIEFWNEPDAGTSPQEGFFHGDIEGFLRTFHLFSQAMRAADPGIRITGPGLCVLHPHERPGFSEAATKRGAPDYDVACFHAHGPLGNYQERELLIETWLKEAGIDKPVCNTETGERAGYDAAGRAAQAVTLVKKIAYAKSRPGTEFYSWFTLQDYWDMDPKADDSFGLVTSDNRIKPSFVAYNALIRELADTVPAGEAALDGHIQAYVFRRADGGTVYVCWPKPGASGASAWLSAGSQPVTRLDLFGAGAALPSLGGLVPVSFGAAPVYLETAPGAPPLAGAALGSGFLDVAGEIRFDPAAPGAFPVRIRNPVRETLTGTLAFEGGDGKAAWTRPVSLAGGAAATFDVPIPAAPDGGAAAVRSGALTLRLDGMAAFRFTLNLIPSYPIRRAPGNPLASNLEPFVRQLPVLALRRQQDVFELAFDPAIPAWRGPDDLSVEARLCHDGAGIYFRFDVTDDKPVQDGPPEKLWNGDSVQVAVASGDAKNYTVFNLGLLKEGPVAWCTDHPDPARQGRWAVPLKIGRQGAVTRYEVYVPFADLGLAASDAAQPVRFAFLVNENDGQGRVRWMHWYDGIAKGRDLDLLGYGTLAGKDGSP